MPLRYRALATDYDGTLARHGQVDADTLAALERIRRSGMRLVLVTGRELPELAQVFAHLDLFDRVVAENGAVLFNPAARAERLLADQPAPAIVAALRAAGVAPLSVGRAIVATWQPHAGIVRRTIRDLGADLHVVLNKGAVMVLPRGIDKTTGLAAALQEIGVGAAETVGIGDAENDLGFLRSCGRSVAVANALPVVKRAVQLVTIGDHGAGVVELIDLLLAGDGP